MRWCRHRTDSTYLPTTLVKKVMNSWEVIIDFGKSVSRVEKFNYDVPFTGDTPYLNIFDFGPSETFDRNTVPKCFWLDTTDHEPPLPHPALQVDITHHDEEALSLLE